LVPDEVARKRDARADECNPRSAANIGNGRSWLE
jgi:hypothetical protein